MGKPIQFGIVFGDKPDRMPEVIDPGYDYLEVALSHQLVPLQSEAVWAEHKARLAVPNTPPITVSSHYISGSGLQATIPQPDWELLEFWTRRAFDRLAQVGVRIVGVYASSLAVPDGVSRTKAMDQAVRFCTLLADHARQHGMVIALEPNADPRSLICRYIDGVAFAKEVGRAEVRVMGDFAYFMQLDEPLENMAQEPEYLVHFHLNDTNHAQPGAGKFPTRRLFELLRDIGYEGGASCACSWVGDFRDENPKTLRWLQQLRSEVWSLEPIVA